MIKLEDKLYTSTEVADILGVSLRSVYRYLEENKIDADVKTATGRHRFSKQNILDFLYPSSTNQKPIRETESTPITTKEPISTLEEHPSVVEESPVVSQTVEKKEVDPFEDDFFDNPFEIEEETVDWLTKFRQAANKTEEVVTPQQSEPEIEEVVEKPSEPVVEEIPDERFEIQDDFKFDPFSSFATDSITNQQTETDEVFYYYKSSLGGLKEIAQNIDKSARKANLHYAFTRQAGMSLHTPIRPFSMLHAYVQPSDLQFFEKNLLLVETTQSNAQLCLIATKNQNIFKEKREMYGLYVVSDLQLKEDLEEAGDLELVSELDRVLIS